MSAYRSKQLECPGCAGPMETTAVSGDRVDRCARCSGMWLAPSQRELVRVAVDGAPLPDGPPASGGRESCPRCDERLAFHAVPGIEAFVPLCVACGGVFIPLRALRELAALARGSE